jgi:acetoin:2,6-dichlorophenolindophenol oxidoreductase subunit beta
MPKQTMAQAINQALREELRRDPRVIVFGEDVGHFGGAFQVTKGLLEEFGEERVRDTPLSETAIVGCAIGAALMGWRPITEMQYSDFVTCAFDQVVNQAAKLRFMSGGEARVPLVLRMPTGAREHGAHHDQSLEAYFVHTPGLKVVFPSTAYDAKGLLKTAIRDDNPVLFFEHKQLYGTHSVGGHGLKAEETGDTKDASRDVPEEEYLIPFGQADIKREGDDLTVIATGLMVHRALEAARQLKDEGISAEILDPRTLVPLDKRAILASVAKTHRALVVTEETRTASVAAEIAAMIGEEGFDYLDAPVVRLGTTDSPLPFSPAAQAVLIPNVASIITAARKIILR